MKKIITSVLIILINFSSYANNLSYKLYRAKLKNGLSIIVKEDTRAPVVMNMVWYKVGSADETAGLTGIAHVLEHLMFKGTKKYPLGVFSKTISALGGQENAFTNQDYTAYFEKLASMHLEKGLELEADRMQNLEFNQTEFTKEISVIREERRLRTDDNPQGLAFERFLAAAHLTEPYHHPVIGWMYDLYNIKLDSVKNWYKTYYGPNNATLVVVGAVDHNKVFTLAEKYFGKIKAIKIPPKANIQEPKALGEKSVIIKTEAAKIPMILIGYTVPSINDKKDPKAPYVLTVINALLSAGDNARLTQNLIYKKRSANSAEVYYDLYSRYQTQFVLYATPNNKINIQTLKKDLLKELQDLQNKPVSQEELARIKQQIKADRIFSHDAIFNEALEIGMLETIGSKAELANNYIQEIETVTPADIQRVAKKYFQPQMLTTAILEGKTT